jgi:hypothetical protein
MSRVLHSSLGKWTVRIPIMLAVLAVFAVEHAWAQDTYHAGQSVSPAFEGWKEEPDGSVTFVFGYMNRNWEEEPVVPVGPDNFFSPGPEDRGQPTRFLPRRNFFTFEVTVPPEFFADSEELIWTVTVNGETHQAFASRNRDYSLDNLVMMSETGALSAGFTDESIRGNQPPQVELEGDTVRTIGVGQPLTLVARVTDDLVLAPNQRRLSLSEAAERSAGASEASDDLQLEPAWLRPPTRVVPGKTVGLHFSWFVYRGSSVPRFEPEQVLVWQDPRPFTNSPWSPGWRVPSLPEDDRWVVQVVFDEPGEYVLRGRADDGGLLSDVDVRVNVVPLIP